MQIYIQDYAAVKIMDVTSSSDSESESEIATPSGKSITIFVQKTNSDSSLKSKKPVLGEKRRG